MATRNSRRRNPSGLLDPFAQRRRRYEAVLEPLGLGEAFAAMPRRTQDLICQHKVPDPLIDFDASVPDDPEHTALRKTLESAFRAATLEVDFVDVKVRDFFAVIGGLVAAVRGAIIEPGIPETCLQFLREARPQLDRWYEPNFKEAFLALHQAVTVPLVAHGRLDRLLLWATLRQDPMLNGKYVIRMTVHATEPQARRVELDGASRPMVRVGTGNEWHGVQWLAWDAAQFGPPQAPSPQSTMRLAERPVYAQSHALRQLRERANLATMAPYLEYWLYQSLKEPRIVERQASGDLLVEYRIQTARIGYLVVTPLADCVAVRTFLFLTMEPSPESRLLKQQLRLTRRDVNYLGLQELTAFTQTDLRDDPELRSMLEACGCGHLFELDEANFAPEPKAFAAEMRRYLRMAA